LSKSRVWPPAIAYCVLTLAWFAILDSGRLDGEESHILASLVAVAFAHLVFGFAIGRWWALMLPAGAIILAVPWGFPETHFEDNFPLFFVQAVYAIPEVFLLAMGVTIGKLMRWVAARSS
jgi:hypothetical protein